MADPANKRSLRLEEVAIAGVQAALSRLTDREIGGLLTDMFMRMPEVGNERFLVLSASNRLKRSSGGPSEVPK